MTAPVLHNQCEAYRLDTLKQCTEWGEFSHTGHRCCWLHRVSAEHPERNGGIIWIQEVWDGLEGPLGELPF